MRRILVVLLSCLSVLTPAVLVSTAGPAAAIPAGVGRMSLALTPLTSGWDLFNSSSFPMLYRKSTSVMATDSANLKQWYCAPDNGAAPALEVIRWGASTDSGHTWPTPSGSNVILTGTPNSADAGGVCDPNVVLYGGYYYLAYAGKAATSTATSVFLARSTAPGGPYLKWTGTGWGNAPVPAPVIDLGHAANGPSMIVKNTTLSLYYDVHYGSPDSSWQTRLATVDIATNPSNWPSRLADQGSVIEHPGTDVVQSCSTGTTADSTDVKWQPALGKFVAVSSDGLTFKQSTIQTYESTDGVSFRKSITRRGAWQANTHMVSLVGDPSGQIVAGTPRSVVYNHDDSQTNCLTRITTISPYQLSTPITGWVDEPLSSSATNWQPRAGTWQIDSAQSAYTVDTAGTGTGWTTLLANQLSDTATIDVDVASLMVDPSFGTPWVGVQFGQTNPSDFYTSGAGYMVKLDFYGNVNLFRAGFIVASGTTPVTNDWVAMRHLRVVQTNGNIAVYVGRKGVGMNQPVLTYNESQAPAPFVDLGGYVSLLAAGDGKFRAFTATDNVPSDYEFDDWAASIGTWTLGSDHSTLTSQSTSGQNFLQADTTVAGDANAHLGDGTYQATISMNNVSDPANARAGINITNYSTTPKLQFGDQGYIAFVYANGKVVLDVPGTAAQQAMTGLNPVAAPVTLRVVKRGSSVQVFVNDQDQPVINYLESQVVQQVGGFGIGNVATNATFTDVSYSADNGS